MLCIIITAAVISPAPFHSAVPAVLIMIHTRSVFHHTPMYSMQHHHTNKLGYPTTVPAGLAHQQTRLPHHSTCRVLIQARFVTFLVTGHPNWFSSPSSNKLSYTVSLQGLYARLPLLPIPVHRNVCASVGVIAIAACFSVSSEP